MFEVQEALELQKQEFARKVSPQCKNVNRSPLTSECDSSIVIPYLKHRFMSGTRSPVNVKQQSCCQQTVDAHRSQNCQLPMLEFLLITIRIILLPSW